MRREPPVASAAPVAHGTATVQFDTFRRRYAVRCICGWIGVPVTTSQEAWAAIDAHLAEARELRRTEAQN